MKLYTINWLRPSKRSASVFLPPGASKTYSLSTLTHGNCRRSALTASRCRVRFFSFASSSLRAVIHSSRDTTLGLSIVLVLVTPLLMTLSPWFESTRSCQLSPFSSRPSWREICKSAQPPPRPSRSPPRPSSPNSPNMPDTSVLLWSAVVLPPLSQPKPHPAVNIHRNRAATPLTAPSFCATERLPPASSHPRSYTPTPP